MKMNRSIALIIIIGILAVFIFCMCLINVFGGVKRQSGKVLNTGLILDSSATEWNGLLPVSGEDSTMKNEQIIIPGYADLVLEGNDASVQLINPSGNTVYMVYGISYLGKELLKTGAISPGTSVGFVPADVLEPGEYSLIFSISTYDVENFEPCNGATMDVNVKIK